MMKKVYFLMFDAGRLDINLPIFWFGLKQYYALNGKHATEWEWVPPVIDYDEWTIDQICQEAIAHRADVYAFSSYVWNWNLVRTVSARIRAELPNAIIVLGGPHQGTTHTDPIFWFKKNPQFDATCMPTEYGEFFLTDLLDALVDNSLDWNTIRNSYYRLGKGPLADKRSFQFPSNVISSNLDIALAFSAHAKKKQKQFVILYETTRGCPYGCTYCEWGGGINSKVIAKPLDIIKDDLSYITMLDISTLYLCDANFGILPRDAELAELFATFKSFGLKLVTLMGLTKSSTNRRLAVLEPLFKSGIIKRYMMAIQSINPTVLSNIDRTDITLEENLETGKYFIETYDAEVTVELILGLPGSTVDDYYKELDYFYTDYSASKYFIYVLPDSPYADPAYIDKWKIKLVPVGVESEVTDESYYAVYDKTITQEPLTYLSVSSYSFTVEDWKEITFMADMEMILTNRHMLKPFTDFMIKNKQIPASLVLKKVYNILKSIKEFYQPVDRYLSKVANGEYASSDWKMVKDDVITGHVFYVYHYLWIQNRSKIFQKLRESFKEELDSMAADCLNYTEHSTLREDNDVVWSSHWNWIDWEINENRGTPPDQVSITLKTEAKPIQWHPTIDRTDHTLDTQTGMPLILPKFYSDVYNLKDKRQNKYNT
jgi:hypothetical protein